MKKFLPAALSALLMLSACSGANKPVSSADAPSEILKQAALIAESSEAKSEDVTKLLTTMIEDTAKSMDYQVTIDHNAKSSSVTVQDGALQSVENDSTATDTRIATTEAVYEMLSQRNGEQTIVGLMEANKDATWTIYGEQENTGANTKNLVLQSIDQAENSEDYTAEELEDVARNTVLYPFFSMVGANLILQPFTNAGYYDFSLTKSGSNYVLSMSIRDAAAYNEALDAYVMDHYGYERVDLNTDGSFMADSYVTTKVDIAITCDENGIISKIENSVHSTIAKDEEELDSYTDSTWNITKTSENVVTFLSDTFDQVQAGDIKKGDTIQLP